MEYVGRDRARGLVEEYDEKVSLLVLVTIYELLNLNHIENPPQKHLMLVSLHCLLDC
jgi:hypothetical protein